MHRDDITITVETPELSPEKFLNPKVKLINQMISLKNFSQPEIINLNMANVTNTEASKSAKYVTVSSPEVEILMINKDKADIELLNQVYLEKVLESMDKHNSESKILSEIVHQSDFIEQDTEESHFVEICDKRNLHTDQYILEKSTKSFNLRGIYS
ncbi:hypothetical protein TNCV_2941091 [Trichonephila clavipes]|nr:hypothetical protein TNCV_2941091 [Trichonephila clavipes]